jgi:hypothetical protein
MFQYLGLLLLGFIRHSLRNNDGLAAIEYYISQGGDSTTDNMLVVVPDEVTIHCHLPANDSRLQNALGPWVFLNTKMSVNISHKGVETTPKFLEYQHGHKTMFTNADFLSLLTNREDPHTRGGP